MNSALRTETETSTYSAELRTFFFRNSLIILCLEDPPHPTEKHCFNSSLVRSTQGIARESPRLKLSPSAPLPRQISIPGKKLLHRDLLRGIAPKSIKYNFYGRLSLCCQITRNCRQGVQRVLLILCAPTLSISPSCTRPPVYCPFLTLPMPRTRQSAWKRPSSSSAFVWCLRRLKNVTSSYTLPWKRTDEKSLGNEAIAGHI
jgi:hypothetical protein